MYTILLARVEQLMRSLKFFFGHVLVANSNELYSNNCMTIRFTRKHFLLKRARFQTVLDRFI